MSDLRKKQQKRLRRRKRVRKKMFGTAERPRLTVSRSLNNIYAQIIDDSSGRTLVSSSTQEKAIKETLKGSGNKDAAVKVGSDIAAKALGKNIKQVVFDRNGFLYHGRVKSLADAAREGGLEF